MANEYPDDALHPQGVPSLGPQVTIQVPTAPHGSLMQYPAVHDPPQQSWSTRQVCPSCSQQKPFAPHAPLQQPPAASGHTCPDPSQHPLLMQKPPQQVLPSVQGVPAAEQTGVGGAAKPVSLLSGG